MAGLPPPSVCREIYAGTLRDVTTIARHAISHAGAVTLRPWPGSFLPGVHRSHLQRGEASSAEEGKATQLRQHFCPPSFHGGLPVPSGCREIYADTLGDATTIAKQAKSHPEVARHPWPGSLLLHPCPGVPCHATPFIATLEASPSNGRG